MDFAHRLDVPSPEIVQVQRVFVALFQLVLLVFRHHAVLALVAGLVPIR